MLLVFHPFGELVSHEIARALSEVLRNGPFSPEIAAIARGLPDEACVRVCLQELPGERTVLRPNPLEGQPLLWSGHRPPEKARSRMREAVRRAARCVQRRYDNRQFVFQAASSRALTADEHADRLRALADELVVF